MAMIFEGGSRTALTKLIRRLPESEAWKRAVFIRDRFQCQHCGKRNGRKIIIEADHIKPLSILIRENDITTVVQALNCVLLWDTSNGRTLCHTCHEKTESYPKQLVRKHRKVKNQ